MADYRGLTVSDITAVRRDLRGKGITYRVVKNRLAKIAAQEAGNTRARRATDRAERPGHGRRATRSLSPRRSSTRSGRTARSRFVAPCSTASGSTRDAVTRLATLPSREVLLGQLAGGIVSPLATMASLLAAPLRNLGYALQQVADQKAANQQA